MPRTAPTISEPNRMLSMSMTSKSRSMPGLVVDAGVEVDVAHQVGGEVGFVEHVRQSAVAAPVIGHRAAAVRDHEAQFGEVTEQVALEELHEGGRVGVDVVRAGRVEIGVATARDVDHGRHFELDHGLVDRIPGRVGEAVGCPIGRRSGRG